jgi:tol-pal system protein YbgF
MTKGVIFSILLLTSSFSYAGAIKSRSLDESYSVTTSNEQIESMQREIQSLTSKVEILERSVHELKKKLDTKSDIEANADGESPMVKRDQDNSAKPAKVSKGSEKQVYDSALSALKINDYSYAIKKFEEFISSFPESQLLGNAHFWSGEAYLKQKAFDKAALQFLKSYKSAPKGPKSSDSLQKLAFTLADLKKNKDACGILNKLDNEFPTRSEPSLKKTKELRTKLKCN